MRRTFGSRVTGAVLLPLLAGACTSAEGMLAEEPTHVVAHAPRDHVAVKECVREALAVEESVAAVRHGSDGAQSWIVRPTANLGGGNVLWVTQFYIDSTEIHGGWHVGNRHGDNLLPIVERCIESTGQAPARVHPAAAVEAVAPVAAPEPPAALVEGIEALAARLDRLVAERRRLDDAIRATCEEAEAAGLDLRDRPCGRRP